MKTQLDADTYRIRRATCAGRFYPDDAAQLRAEIDSYLALTKAVSGAVPKAIIAPHAGYMYSGPVAASAYARLALGRTVIRRVVLVGPSHYAEFPGLATSGVDAFMTPLGPVPLDTEAIGRALALPHVHVVEEAHRPEHSLEVHLPFLQMVLEEFTLVPLLVAEALDEEISSVLRLLWGGPETCIVISSDLSHYHNYKTAKHRDQITSQAIESLRPDELAANHACGCRPIRGLLRTARQHRLRCQTVDLRNSGDIAGSRDQVVGYGAYVFTGE